MIEQVIFDKETHTYWLGDKQLISVTQLLAKHGLSTDYSGVGGNTLKQKADRGKLIHEEIENYIKAGEFGFTSEFVDYMQIMADENFTAVNSETKVWNNELSGTYDLLAKRNDQYILIDFKTTSKLDKESIAWQLGLYNYLSPIKAQCFFVFHLLPNHRSKAIEVLPKTTEQIERLLECERNGEIYEENLPEITFDERQLAELARCEMQIAELKRQQEAFDEIKDNIRAAIILAMEKAGVKSFESELLKITYIAPFEREQIDTTKLKTEQPEIAKAYTKQSPIGASLRIKVKGD